MGRGEENVRSQWKTSAGWEGSPMVPTAVSPFSLMLERETTPDVPVSGLTDAEKTSAAKTRRASRSSAVKKMVLPSGDQKGSPALRSKEELRSLGAPPAALMTDRLTF